MWELFSLFLVCSLKLLGSYFVRGDKVSKLPFCAIDPKVQRIIVEVFLFILFSLLFLLTFVVNQGHCLSIIFAFLLSAFQVVFSQASSLRIAHVKLRRSFLLSPSWVNRLSLFTVTTLYPLTTRHSLVADRRFSLV